MNLKSGSCQSQNVCLSKDNCPSGVCPDFTIRRHDTKPPFKIFVEDCDGPMDFRGLVIEANMWAIGKLKTEIDEDDDYFRLADDIGFEQVMMGDIIVMDRVRMPERMLVTGFDETNNLIRVQRGYHGTTPAVWKKGTKMRGRISLGMPPALSSTSIMRLSFSRMIVRRQIRPSFSGQASKTTDGR